MPLIFSLALYARNLAKVNDQLREKKCHGIGEDTARMESIYMKFEGDKFWFVSMITVSLSLFKKA